MTLQSPATSSVGPGRVESRTVDKKKRASQACHHCRTRKVKCDLVKSGVPCHNCKTDGIECVTLESRRSRKYRLQKRQLAGLVSLPTLIQAQPKTEFSPSPITASVSATDNAEATRDVANHQRDENHALPTARPPFPSPLSATPGSSQSHENVGALGPTNAPIPNFTLPSYIQPARSGIRADDIEFLSYRGALTLPAPELRDKLLRCFVLYVYPYMPIIDLEDLFSALDGKPGATKISLTVFQAIMFAGTAFVDFQLLQALDYENRRAARADFYQKIKVSLCELISDYDIEDFDQLLYDFDWDVDRISLTQTLLLANYWYVSEHDQKDPWHWLGVCVSLASSIGLNQVSTYAKKDAKTCRLWRRIWWSCVMRDRIIAISMRKPIRIKDEDLNLPLPVLDDFEICSVRTSISALQHCPSLTDPATRKVVADLCIAKVNLLLTIGHIIQTLYELRVFGGSQAEATMLYKPKTTPISSNEVSNLQNELDAWYGSLPVSCWLSSITLHNGPHQAIDDALFLHRAVLRMIYLMATEALNRPQTLSMSKTSSLGVADQGSTSKVNEAAENMSDMMQCLQDRDLVRFLPPLSVGFILLSLAAFAVEIKTKSTGFEDFAAQKFHRCVRALWQLRETWPIADTACFLVGQMVSKTQVGVISTPDTRLTVDGGHVPPIGVETKIPGEHTPTYDQTPSNTFTPTPLPPALPPAPAVNQPLGAADLNSMAAPPEPPAGAWTGWEMDLYGVTAKSHSLHMDLALLECDGFGDFQTNFAGFGSFPQGDQFEGELFTYGADGQMVQPSGWNGMFQDSSNPNQQYMNSFLGPRPG